MTDEKKIVHGGMEDNIGIAQDVTKSSLKRNDLNNATSNAGKVLPEAPLDKRKK